MKKHVKLLLYGAPGAGKSSFAVRLPKPFFITTDGNYEWLDVWGAKEEDHVTVFNWKEAKTEISKPRDGYETIVVDLLEDLFKWSEEDFCVENQIKHISHLGWGEGYDRQRNDFLNTINRIINENKNVILIMHETALVSKDRRGVESTYFRPSNRIPDKVIDVIEGRTNVLRCYLEAERDENGNIIKTRKLSLVPKENEYAIIRGVDESTLPQDIELDPELFCKYFHLTDDIVEVKKTTKKPEPQPEVKEAVKEFVKEEPKVEPKVEEHIKVEPKVEQKVEEPKTEEATTSKPKSIEDLRAAIKAKLAAKNNGGQ